MPEGDSIHVLARRIAPDLEGATVRILRLRHRGEVSELQGETVGSVEALGKHLLIALGERWALHVHLAMRGRWRVYAGRGPLPRGAEGATLLLCTDSSTHLCFRGRVELRLRSRLALDPRLTRLGQDLLAPEVDMAAIVRRARAPRRAQRAIGEMLLDQRVACGLGNVYKSELCFLLGLHPFTPASAVDDETLVRLYRLGRTLLSRNVPKEPSGPQPRVTRPRGATASKAPLPKGQRLWVYQRRGEPCHRCGEPIELRLQGDDRRPTYLCPGCQPSTRTSV